LFFSSAHLVVVEFLPPGHRPQRLRHTHDPQLVGSSYNFSPQKFIEAYAQVGHIGIFVEKIAQLSASDKFWLV
jgi:hypothetical protein